MRHHNQKRQNRKRIEASLLEFARTGQLGPFRCGMSRDEVTAALGNPTDWMLDWDLSGNKPETSHMETSLIWWYGDIEFHFDDDLVSVIFTDHEGLCDGGKMLHIDPWVIRPELPRAEFELELAKKGIQFKVIAFPKVPSECCVVTTGGVEFFFSECCEHEADPPVGMTAWSKSLPRT